MTGPSLHFVPYSRHAEAELPNNLEKVLARDPDKFAALQETLLARKRWVQYLDAGCMLTGKHVRIPKKDGQWETFVVRNVERHSGTAEVCFVLVSLSSKRYSVTPETELMMERPNN